MTTHPPQTTALIILSHGSTHPQSTAIISNIISQLRQTTPYKIIQHAQLTHTPPSLSDAFNNCAKLGAIHIIIAPFFLLPGTHISTTIPNLAANAAKHHPDITYTITPPLALNPKITTLLSDHINNASYPPPDSSSLNHTMQ